MPSGVALAAIVAGVGLGAAIDIRTRRIPNVITLGTAVTGLGLAFAGWSGISPASSMLGLLLGLLFMLPGYVFGGTGAGDVKLMAAVGAVLGVQRIVPAVLLTAIAGGVLAVVIAIGTRRFGATLRRTGWLLTAPAEASREIKAPDAGNRFAYAPAILLGSVLAALVA